mgnify:CR=1 FL=1
MARITPKARSLKREPPSVDLEGVMGHGLIGTEEGPVTRKERKILKRVSRVGLGTALAEKAR